MIGAAFALVVKSLNDNLLMPIIAMIGGKPDFSSLTFTINGAVFRYGAFITDLIGFILTAAAVFFFVVKPINSIVARRKRGEQVAPEETPEEIELLREIRDALESALTRPGTPALGCCQAGIMGRCVSRSSVSGSWVDRSAWHCAGRAGVPPCAATTPIPRRAAVALERGCVEAADGDLASACRGADLVVVCAPVAQSPAAVAASVAAAPADGDGDRHRLDEGERRAQRGGRRPWPLRRRPSRLRLRGARRREPRGPSCSRAPRGS